MRQLVQVTIDIEPVPDSKDRHASIGGETSTDRGRSRAF
jgi:hypothetical protein